MSEAAALVARVCASCGARYPEDALFCPIDGAPLQSDHGFGREAEDPYLGQEIAGHIEIRQLVGIGAMGRVYRAFQRGIDRDVAVKILHRELSANAQLVSRFTREAKVASRLQHPNVVQVIMAGQLPDRALYMAMEFLDGLSLQSAILAAGGSLALDRALHIALQLCEAAGEAHAQGIVHRDLKPENVMLVRRGADEDFVKVLDFGIARINWGEQSVATAAGLIFGTARYISPEGAQGHAVGPASDVYAIATLLFQMLAGRTPFEGEQAVGLLVQQIHDAPPSLRSIPRGAYVPEPIAEVVMANLAKDPARREPDARALGQVLVDAAKRAGLSPEEISRPILRRPSSVMQLASLERTRQLDGGVDLGAPAPTPTPSAGIASKLGEKPPTGATVKWEPPTEFQARLSAELANVATPEPTPSRPRAVSVDTTLDDATAPPAPSLPSSPSFPAPSSHPRTVVEEARVPTQYTPPAAATIASESPRGSDPNLGLPPPPSSRSESPVPEAPRTSRGSSWLFVVLCFALGVLGAAGIAWKLGKLGADPEPERTAARAQEALFGSRFAAPPGENVRDITDAALRRWPGDRRFLEIRERAASELVTQAQAKRAGDAHEALRLAKLASDLDPKDAGARRLVEQIEGDLTPVPTSSAPPLPVGAVPTTPVKAPPGAPASPARVVLELAPASPRATTPTELTAKVTSKTPLEGAAFVVSGPGLASPSRVEATSSEPNVFKSAFAFPQAGRYEVAFTAVDGGKSVRAARAVQIGAASAPPTATAPTAPTTAPTTAPPAPSAGVKWL